MYAHGSWQGRLSSRECEWPVSSGPSFPSCSRPFLSRTINTPNYFFSFSSSSSSSSLFCVVNVRDCKYSSMKIFIDFIDDVRVKWLWAGSLLYFYGPNPLRHWIGPIPSSLFFFYSTEAVVSYTLTFLPKCRLTRNIKLNSRLITHLVFWNNQSEIWKKKKKKLQEAT